jgi:hypothetical protein
VPVVDAPALIVLLVGARSADIRLRTNSARNVVRVAVGVN